MNESIFFTNLLFESFGVDNFEDFLKAKSKIEGRPISKEEGIICITKYLKEMENCA